MAEKIMRLKTGFRIINNEMLKMKNAIDSNNQNIQDAFRHLTEIQENNIYSLEEFLQFDKNQPINEPTEPEININKVKPVFCKETKTNTRKVTKKGCSECSQFCLYTIDELTMQEAHPGQKQLNKELQNHGHPTSRNIKRTDSNESEKRTTSEALQELIDHYKFAHL